MKRKNIAAIRLGIIGCSEIAVSEEEVSVLEKEYGITPKTLLKNPYVPKTLEFSKKDVPEMIPVIRQPNRQKKSWYVPKTIGKPGKFRE